MPAQLVTPHCKSNGLPIKDTEMKRCRLMLTVTLCLVAAVVSGQDAKQPKKQAAKKKARPNPAMAKVEDVPGLPRVLLIGDSISIGYTAPVREMLKGVANVHRPLTNCGPTTRGGTISVARDQRANAEALAIGRVECREPAELLRGQPVKPGAGLLA